MNDMAMPAEQRSELMTAEDLELVRIPGKATELVRGRLVVREPPGTYHGIIQSRLHLLVGEYVRAHRLGEVCGQDTGFKIASNPDTVRGPDVAFIRADRVSGIARRGYAPLAPDLIVEVLSPDDRRGEVLAKIGEWLDAGVRLAWVVDPERREAHVYRPDGSVSVLEASGTLDGEDVLPGFAGSLSEVFE
jgi:Uma2 family endonuclease